MKFRERDIQPLTFTAQGGGREIGGGGGGGGRGTARSSKQRRAGWQREIFPLEFHRKKILSSSTPTSHLKPSL